MKEPTTLERLQAFRIEQMEALGDMYIAELISNAETELEAARTRIIEQSTTIADMDVEYGKLQDMLEAYESKSCGEDNGYEDCIAHVLKAELEAAKADIEYMQTAETRAERYAGKLYRAEQKLKALQPYLLHNDDCRGHHIRNKKEAGRHCNCGLQAILREKKS